MSAVVWRKAPAKVAYGRRKVRISAFVSDAAPGIGLQQGEWANFEESEGKADLVVSHGYKAFVLATGAAVGPVIADFTAASAYAVDVSGLRDWINGSAVVEPAVYAKVMRRWFAAAGKEPNAEQQAALDKLEAAA